MDNLLLFVKPLVKRMSVQPTIQNKPFGKPFRYVLFKFGYSFYFVSFKPKFKIQKLGEIRRNAQQTS